MAIITMGVLVAGATTRSMPGAMKQHVMAGKTMMIEKVMAETFNNGGGRRQLIYGYLVDRAVI